MLPAIVPNRDGSFQVLAAISAEQTERPSCLVQVPGESGPVTIDLRAFQKNWSGELILLTPRSGAERGGMRSFNLSWFLPALSKYRRLFTQVVVASFFLQLFALVTPLFFQVVMDKVLVHKGFTTLDVLAFGFVVLVAFEAILGGLRNYLFSHTTNRVDVELGARLFHHLAGLPLAYFEATGRPDCGEGAGVGKSTKLYYRYRTDAVGRSVFHFRFLRGDVVLQPNPDLDCPWRVAVLRSAICCYYTGAEIPAG